MKMNNRYVPFLRNVRLRMTIGYILLVLSVILAETIFKKGQLGAIVAVSSGAWLVAAFLTHKYIHKYPQRYFSYLIASHSKAALIMAFLLLLGGELIGQLAASYSVLWSGYLFFVLADFLVSVPRRREYANKQVSLTSDFQTKSGVVNNQQENLEGADVSLSSSEKQVVTDSVLGALSEPLSKFIESNFSKLQGGISNTLVIDDIGNADNGSTATQLDLLVGTVCLNNVNRLNIFLQYCANRMRMGGYIAVQYVPLEYTIEELQRNYTGLFYWIAYLSHFIWYRAIPKVPWLDVIYFSSKFSWLDNIVLSITKRRNRALPKAEVWGRLAFYGIDVIEESRQGGKAYILARRVTSPVTNKRPSYYPIVALEKVGLDGGIIHMHKIRSMYPFSEFIQKRIFEDHGLTSTGKFSDDFRLTDYGKFIRKYWLDELPQIFDWLRGDIKLVGIRATSQHFLSLYSTEFYNLYIQVKPGLIPPIFDDSIEGFEDIVEVELKYLESYMDKPIKTDINYLMQTFTDIVFRGVRSK